jgi:hypothetical protein
MKKLFVLATAALLVSGAGFAGNGGDKGKEKKKKASTTKTTCPGKECSKKKVAAKG